MGAMRWGEWGTAVARTLLTIKPGESLLILADTWSNMEAAEACLVAGIHEGAMAHLLVLPRAVASDTRVFKAAEGAIMGADVILSLAGLSSRLEDVTVEARKQGARMTSCDLRNAGEWVLVGLLDTDYPLMLDAAEKIAKLWEDTTVCHVTSSAGTDVSFQLKGRPCDLGDGRVVGPGETDFFPGVTPSIAPVESTVNGTIVVDGTVASPYAVAVEPIILHLEQGVITKVEGGNDARAFQELLEASGEATAFHMAHFNIGINAAGKVGNSMEEDEMAMGVVTFGFGRQDPDFKGTVGPCSVHFDVTLRTPNVELDGVAMSEDGRLNPEFGLA